LIAIAIAVAIVFLSELNRIESNEFCDSDSDNSIVCSRSVKRLASCVAVVFRVAQAAKVAVK
jgi:hypothetical protein